ncbi:hypothetical protein GVAV_001016 [Gurleya vavrai]
MSDDFEQKNVHNFYSNHANSFSVTRVIPWPKTVEFLKNDFPLILDAGCGNGRSSHNNDVISLDYSYNLLNQNKCFNKINSCVTLLPFKNETFDALLSVAVIHHLSTPEKRKKALKEMHRVLKNNGRVLIYVWNREVVHKKRFKQINGNDYFVTWNGNNEIIRYYYMYDEKEFYALLIECKFKIVECGLEQESIYAILEKI